MDTASVVQAIIATLAAVIGAGLLVWSLRRPGQARSTTSAKQSPAPAPEAANESTALLPHASWSNEQPSPANVPDTSVARRAAVLSGVQLALLAALLVGGLYLASTVTADQLLPLSR